MEHKNNNIKKEKTIAILYICIGDYTVFWENFYKTCKENFVVDYNKKYFVFTDRVESIQRTEDITLVKVENNGWPYNTMMRYDMFLKAKEEILNSYYTVYFNANIKFEEKITFEEFFEKDKLSACVHPGYYHKKFWQYPLEENKNSTAYFKRNKNTIYYAGGINAGDTKVFVDAIEIINKNIKKDLDNNIIAKVHDETHWNKYINENKNLLHELHTGYLFVKESVDTRRVTLMNKYDFDGAWPVKVKTSDKKLLAIFYRAIRAIKNRLESMLNYFIYY